MSASLRVALFTPLPPARTGIAEYAQSLVPELAKVVRLQVFESVPRRVDWSAFDVAVYQIANNPYHSAIYRLALEHPGISVLHEPNLHDLIRSLTLDSDGEQAYLDEVLYEICGPDRTRPYYGTTIEMPQPRSFTMARHLLDRSAGCVVHSHYSEREVRLKRYRGPVAVIPHGSEPRYLDVRRYRQTLGVPDAAPLVGLFGYQRPDKRCMECLRVFQRLLQCHPDAHLLVAGEPHPEVPVETWVQAENLGGKIHQLGYRPLEDFDAYLAACDVVINLRYPTFGETSGTMMRAFGLGKTVIVSDTGSSQELPEDVCLRIPADMYEEKVLLGVLDWLLDSPSERASIGDRARDWVTTHCTWPQVAIRYAEFAESVARDAAGNTAAHERLVWDTSAASLAEYLPRWVPANSEEVAYFRSHRDRLVNTLQLVPAGRPNDRILEMGCYMQITPALKELLGYGEVRGSLLGPAGETIQQQAVSRSGETFECPVDLFNADIDRFPYPDAHFSTVLCCELLEHLERDPMHMMWEIHRVLRPGGVLILTTPNIVSLRSVVAILREAHPALYPKYGRKKIGKRYEPGHVREYTPEEIRLLLVESGFVVLEMSTKPYSDLQYQEDPGWVVPVLQELELSMDLRGDCIFAVGRSDTSPRIRFPDWLYTN